MPTYPFHKVIQRVEGKVEIEGLHRFEEPLWMQIAPSNTRSKRSVKKKEEKFHIQATGSISDDKSSPPSL